LKNTLGLIAGILASLLPYVKENKIYKQKGGDNEKSIEKILKIITQSAGYKKLEIYQFIVFMKEHILALKIAHRIRDYKAWRILIEALFDRLEDIAGFKKEYNKKFVDEATKSLERIKNLPDKEQVAKIILAKAKEVIKQAEEEYKKDEEAEARRKREEGGLIRKVARKVKCTINNTIKKLNQGP
jgi:hypothetical protein